MKTRILVAAVGIPFLVAVLLAPPWAMTLLVAGMCAVGAFELLRAVAGEAGKSLMPLTALMAALIPLDIYRSSASPDGGLSAGTSPALPSFLAALAMAFLFALFVYAIWRYEKGAPISFSTLTAAMFAGLVFPLLLSCLLRLRLMGMLGKLVVFLPLVIAFGSDTFAYFFGLFFGRHKLAPHVSPKKTIEGAVGGLIGGVIGILLLEGAAWYATGGLFLSWWQTLLLGLAGSAVSQIGDLSFSVIKREFAVKDYGTLLPGHGGVLDRFDSVTFVAPFVWFIFSFLR
ncbi:MAG: phosphatidate cytidylyltransferase [Oscillibacter sp.]